MLKLLRDASDGVLSAWFADCSDEAATKVETALFAICEGTWTQLYEHAKNYAFPSSTVLNLGDGLALVWHVPMEFPGHFRVVYIGPLNA